MNKIHYIHSSQVVVLKMLVAMGKQNRAGWRKQALSEVSSMEVSIGQSPKKNHVKRNFSRMIPT